MTPTHTAKGGRTYRYYVCSAAQKRGRGSCPSKAVPAGAVEAVVVDRVRAAARDLAVVADVLAGVGRRTQTVDAEVTAALAGFDGVWSGLAAGEQARVVRLLVAGAEYDGRAGTLSVRFRDAGLTTPLDANLTSRGAIP